MSNPVSVHRVRFFTPSSMASINGMALNEETKQLALLKRTIAKSGRNRAKSSSLIELWNVSNERAPFPESTIYDNDDCPALLECVAWGAGGRLFACGLDGNLHEYDLVKNCIKKSYAVGGGAVWCMSFNRNKSELIFGNEDGQISAYNIDPTQGDEVNFIKTVAKWPERILCIAWYEMEKNTRIVAGSSEFIGIWKYDSGRLVEKIRVGTKGSLVWCVNVLKNMVIATGDSTGTTSFFDGKTAVLKKSFKSHKADILCICEGSNGEVFSSGVEPTIAQFVFNDDNEPLSSLPINVHSHDIRCLAATSSGWLLSGGIDTYLTRTMPNPKAVHRDLQNFGRLVHSSDNMLLLQNSDNLELWKLDKSSTKSIAKNPIKQTSVTTKRSIIASSFHGNWLSYSTCKGLTVLSMSSNEIKKVRLLIEPLVGLVEEIRFKDSELMSVSTGCSLSILRLDEMGIVLEKNFLFKKHIQEHLYTGSYLIVLFAGNQVKLISTNDWEELASFDLNGMSTVVKVNPFNSSELWFCLANQTMVQYDLVTRRIVNSFSPKVDRFSALRGIAFTKALIIVYSEDKFYSLDKSSGCVRSTSDKYKHIIRMDSLDRGDEQDELYVVELPPLTLFQKLPAAMIKKRYGT